MSVVSIADVRDALGLTSQTPDATVQTLIDHAEGMVSDRVGPLASTAKTFTLTVQSGAIPLPDPRVISVQSITSPWYAPIDVTEVQITGGVLSMIYGVIPASRWTVAYTAGWDTAATTGVLPVQVYAAVIEQCRHLWATRRGSTFKQPNDPAPGTYHAMPWRVEEMLQPYARTGGFA